ncbi:Sulfur transfer protein involved in thiamine biosynthesis [Candidatus Terasakiella magnetica]|uniref:Sulfur transfer protein involved in thiamine biosynthesis n=1 Tax=Candidatus Terasakiella magnetica TaxID=1867952 RepID=A0A1C3RKX8_9PROT|nr:MoaD/ThiS family protein [Candidatus Terasakiella magnetica]SCA57982.1 Sulfur transfer protein involved in thiamine biosynthesis [Candidatus Terasakiella magnetica]
MKVTLKLYAQLGSFLPESKSGNEAEITLEAEKSVRGLLDDFGVPPEHCHLVLVNGEYVEPSAREERLLEENDHLAVWPPVAGG